VTESPHAATTHLDISHGLENSLDAFLVSTNVVRVITVVYSIPVVNKVSYTSPLGFCFVTIKTPYIFPLKIKQL